MRRRKLLTVVIALAASLVTLLSQESLAYYSVYAETGNVITSGEINIKIIEKMGDGNSSGEGVYIMPGSIISKRVSVLNTGANPCWVRVKLTNGADGEADSDEITDLDINLKDWIAGDDGYYYYSKVLEPGVETEKLFSQIKISGSADSSYLGKILKLTVWAFAVQSEHNEGDVLHVFGWPEYVPVTASDVGGGV